MPGNSPDPIPRPDAPALSDRALRQTRRSLPIALLRAREVVMGPIRDMLASSGVNEQKWRVLRVLQESGPMELTQIADEACLLLPSLTRMVRPMEEEGLVLRHVPPQDRRKVVLAISPAGEALVRAHAGQSQAIFDRIEARFGSEQLEQLLDLLEDLRHLDLEAADGDGADGDGADQSRAGRSRTGQAESDPPPGAAGKG